MEGIEVVKLELGEPIQEQVSPKLLELVVLELEMVIKLFKLVALMLGLQLVMVSGLGQVQELGLGLELELE
jgi:hypothetical protein